MISSDVVLPKEGEFNWAPALLGAVETALATGNVAEFVVKGVGVHIDTNASVLVFTGVTSATTGVFLPEGRMYFVHNKAFGGVLLEDNSKGFLLAPGQTRLVYKLNGKVEELVLSAPAPVVQKVEVLPKRIDFDQITDSELRALASRFKDIAGDC